MKTKKDAIKIIEILKGFYPDATCSLDFTTPFEMMVAVMLSAQCTDERVNKTTPDLFKKYNTPKKISEIKLEELEKGIIDVLPNMSGKIKILNIGNIIASHCGSGTVAVSFIGNNRI